MMNHKTIIKHECKYITIKKWKQRYIIKDDGSIKRDYYFLSVSVNNVTEYKKQTIKMLGFY